MAITDDTPYYRVPGLCYPQDIWHEVDEDTGAVGWYGVGLNAARDVFRLTGREDKTPRVVTEYNGIRDVLILIDLWFQSSNF